MTSDWPSRKNETLWLSSIKQLLSFKDLSSIIDDQIYYNPYLKIKEALKMQKKELS